MKPIPAPHATPRARLRQFAAGLTLCGCLLLPGCGFLKPANNPVHYYMLSAVPPAPSIPAGAPGVGVGQVKLPAYLFNTSLAVRRGSNEVVYLPLALWAERLDTSAQRVLAADLAASLPTDKIRLSAWRTDEVNVEVYVSIERCDVDTAGHATLIAWWRITPPGAEKTWKSGQVQLTCQGPSPDLDPGGAVGALSGLLAEFSQQLAGSIKEVLPAAK